MKTKVLIVDDSSFFRKRLTEIINGDATLEVIGEAKDGKEAVDMTAKLHPDVITMDVEMPVMDGITAVKQIMSRTPTPIMMFSSLTFEGTNATFKALEAGAIDFMPKNFADIAHRKEDALNNLRSAIKAVARSRVKGFRHSSSFSSTSSAPAGYSTTTTATGSTFCHTTGASSGFKSSTSAARVRVESSDGAGGSGGMAIGQYRRINAMLDGTNGNAAARKFTFGNHKEETTAFRRSGKTHALVAIGSSTGGPIALQNIIPKLPKLPVPVVIVQHMPSSFTATFAQRLDGISKLHVVEAKDGDILQAGNCYIAPGGMQMIFERAGTSAKVRVLKDASRVSYNPCVDVSFASLAQIYGGRVLAMILTGMGSDGCEGCRLLKSRGAVIWAQNEDSCVVYGMPQAIVNAGLADLVLPLEDIAQDIVKEF